MTIDIKQFLSLSYVISISDRQYDNFCNEFRLCGLDTNYIKRYPGVILPNGVYHKTGLIKTKNIINCTLSHIGIVSQAYANNLPFVVVFEDDAIPCIDIISKLQNYLSDIPDDCHMLKLGWCKSLPYQFDQRKYQQKSTLGSHSYIIFKPYYNQYLSKIYIDLTADLSCMNDDKYIYVTNQPLFIQKSITNNNITGVDYTELYKSFDISYFKTNFNI